MHGRNVERDILRPLRLPINDVFKGDRGGQSIGGKLEAGALKVSLSFLTFQNLVKSMFKFSSAMQ